MGLSQTTLGIPLWERVMRRKTQRAGHTSKLAMWRRVGLRKNEERRSIRFPDMLK